MPLVGEVSEYGLPPRCLRQSRSGIEGGGRADRSARRSCGDGYLSIDIRAPVTPSMVMYVHVPCSALLLVGSKTVATSKPFNLPSPPLPATSLAKPAWAAYRTVLHSAGVVPSDSDLVCTADATSRGAGTTVHYLLPPPKTLVEAPYGMRMSC